MTSRLLTDVLRRAHPLISAHSLHALAMIDSNGPTKLGILAMEIGITTAACTGLADKLESCGFAQRVHMRTDRRTVHLTITEAGKAALATMLTAA